MNTISIADYLFGNFTMFSGITIVIRRNLCDYDCQNEQESILCRRAVWTKEHKHQ